jgi:glyoxylase I family protein
VDAGRALRRFTHLSLSVRDLDVSLDFYHGVLGLPVFRQPYEGEVFDGREAMLLVGGVALCLQQHRANPGDPFDPRRSGLDHFAFAVDDLKQLQAWAATLTARGIQHSNVKPLPGYGYFIELRDPDSILIELHCTDQQAR